MYFFSESSIMAFKPALTTTPEPSNILAINSDPLRWLIALRWWALSAAMLAILLAPTLNWNAFLPQPFIAGVALGGVVNFVLILRARKSAQAHSEDKKGRAVDPRELVLHLVTDIAALTWLLACSGGLLNPFIVFYAAPVLLGALLAGSLGAWTAMISSFCGLVVLWVVTPVQLLQTNDHGQLGGELWNSKQKPFVVLYLIAVVLLMMAVSYFSLEVVKRVELARRKAEADELKVHNKRIALENLATLGRALQGVAHELNTPLSTMTILANDLQHTVSNLKIGSQTRSDFNESLTIIEREAARCGRLTHALLSARPKSAPNPGVHRLGPVVQRSLESLGLFQERDPLAKVRVSKPLEYAKGYFDPEMLQQILMNLIQNAIHATRENPDHDQGCAEQGVWVELEEGDGKVYIAIGDSGVGFATKIQKHLFEPFVTTRESGDGTGLGLYTARSLAQSFGAEVRLLKSSSEGSIMQVVLLNGAPQ